MVLVDSHLHLTDFEPSTDIEMLLTEASEAGVTHFICNSTSEDDWQKVYELARIYPQVIPCFGLHPWFVENRLDGWHSRLEELVRTTKCGVGEIGLDRAISSIDKTAQEDVFRAQLELARKYERPAMVHCVKSWGWLMDILRSEQTLSCGMLLHSYGGPVDLIEQLTKMGAYFSFSGRVLSENRIKQRQALLAVPPDRLLIETDAPYMLPPDEFRYKTVLTSEGKDHNHPANLSVILEGIAELLEESPEYLLERLSQNSKIFLSSILTY